MGDPIFQRFYLKVLIFQDLISIVVNFKLENFSRKDIFNTIQVVNRVKLEFLRRCLYNDHLYKLLYFRHCTFGFFEANV